MYTVSIFLFVYPIYLKFEQVWAKFLETDTFNLFFF